MADLDPNSDPILARATLIQMIEDGKWEFTPRAKREGMAAMRYMRGRDAFIDEIIEYICELLKRGFPIESVELGDPPRSNGIGWVMKNPDGRDTYIKLKIEFRVTVLSCHPSIHSKK